MRAVGTPGRAPLLGLVAVLVAAAAVAARGGAADIAKALPDPLGASGTSAPNQPFAGEQVVYGRHVLTSPQVTALQKAAGGSAVPVYSSEEPVATGDAIYPQVPVSTMIVDPARYASVAATPTLADQLSRGLVLSRAEAGLRHVSVGGRVRLVGGRSLPVTAVVDAHVIGGYEMATAPAVLAAPAGPSYLLVPATVPAAALRGAAPEISLRVRTRTLNGYFSGTDTVLPQARMKALFGEFATSTTGSSLRLDASWRRDWLRSAALPQLGVVTCNKSLLAPLRAAMQEVTARGLGAVVHSADFRREGGCWSPRIVRFSEGGRISSHAWGIAVDINVDVNPLGSPPRQDPRLVDIMRRHGFAWGGDFLRPDGAHFEWVGHY